MQLLAVSLALAAIANAAPIQLNNVETGLLNEVETTTSGAIKRDDSLDGLVPANGGLIPEVTGSLLSSTGLKRDEPVVPDVPAVDAALYELDVRDELGLEEVIPEVTSLISPTGLKRDELGLEDLIPEITSILSPTGLKRDELGLENLIPKITSIISPTGLKRDEIGLENLIPEITSVISPTGLKRDDLNLEDIVPELTKAISAARAKRDELGLENLIPEVTSIVSPTGLKRDELNLNNIGSGLTNSLPIADGLKRDVLDSLDGEIEKTVQSTGL